MGKKKRKDEQKGRPLAEVFAALDEAEGWVETFGDPFPRRFDSVAIVGFAPEWYQMAPMTGEGRLRETEFWGFNPPSPWHDERRHLFTRWFDVHDLEIHEVRRH